MRVANVPALMTGIDHAIVLLLDKPGLWLDHMGYDDAPVDAVQIPLLTRNDGSGGFRFRGLGVDEDVRERLSLQILSLIHI